MACGGLFEGLGFAVELAVDEGLVGVASLAGTVDDVDFVALFEEERGPAAPAVGVAVPVATLAVASVDEHDRIRVAHYGGDPVFDEHLHAVADGAAGEQGMFDAVEAEGPFGDVEDGAGIGGRLCADLGRQRCERTCGDGSEFTACYSHGLCPNRRSYIVTVLFR